MGRRARRRLARVPRDLPLLPVEAGGLRCPPRRDPEELEAILAPLASAGVDAFHASTRRYWRPELDGSDLNLAGWTKKLTGRTAITVGSVGLDGDFTKAFLGEGAPVGSLDNLLDRLERDEFDLVAVGRALLQDPRWAEKVLAGNFDALAPYDAASLKSLS
ncbi:hypothetical protein LV779_30380 [Streptomyces thinghirensis]|nr:hypothetical protein [Streptomyces thinghirensis]